MLVCPNCGTSNPETSRFCSNCGASLAGVSPGDTGTGADAGPRPTASPAEATEPSRPEATEPSRRPPIPPPVDLPPSARPPTDPEWRMSDPGPLPEPRGRRTWLWVLGGILGACLLACCALTILGNTVFEDDLAELQTELAEELTESPDP